MTVELTRDDRLWLGAHGDQRYADEWAELQRREDRAAQIERTRVKIRELDEDGTDYTAAYAFGHAEPIAVFTG